MPIIDDATFEKLKSNDPGLVELNLFLHRQKPELKLGDTKEPDISLSDKELSAISKNTTVKKLIVCSLCSTMPIAKNISDILETNSTINHLLLNCSPINDKFLKDYWKLIFKGISQNKSIKILTIGYFCNNDAYHSLGELLASNQTITHINFEQTFIPLNYDIKSISIGLKSNKTLKSLCFRLEKDTNITVDSLCKALAINSTLSILDISRNNQTREKDRENSKFIFMFESINTAGAKKIANMLKVNKGLQVLSLDYHYDIGNSGVCAIASALETNSTLKELSLKRCDIDDVGATFLANALVHNKSLIKLNLSENNISDAGLIEFSNLLSRNNTLESVIFEDGFSSRNISKPILNRLDKNLTSNKKNRASEKKLTTPTRLQNEAILTTPTPVVETKEFAQPIPIAPSLNTNDYHSTTTIETSNLEIKQESPEGFFQSLGAIGGSLMNRMFGQGNQFDEETVKKLQSLANSLDHSIFRKIDQMEQEIITLNNSRSSLRAFEGKDEEVSLIVNRATEDLFATAELEYIEKDDVLREFYYVLRCQILHVWQASNAIKSGWVSNDNKTKLEYLSENIDKFGKRLPGLSLLTGFIKQAVTFWDHRAKKMAINNMSGLFVGFVQCDKFVDILARQLTIAQEAKIKEKLIPTKMSKIKEIAGKVYDGYKRMENFILVTGINTKTQQFAGEQASKIIENVMKRDSKDAILCKQSKDISKLFEIIMGDNVTYQPPACLLAVRATGNSHSLIHSSLGCQVKPTQPAQEFKKEFEERDKKIQEQDTLIKQLQENINQLKQNQDKTDNMSHQVLSLQTELNTIRTRVSKKDEAGIKNEIDALRIKVSKLEEESNGSSVSVGNGMAQLNSVAKGKNGGDSQMSLQLERVFDLESQVKLLRTELQATKENHAAKIQELTKNAESKRCIVM